MQRIFYRQLGKGDQLYFQIGTALIRSSQGAGAVGDQQLELMSQAKECCVFGAFADEELVGVATGGILPKNQFDFYVLFSRMLPVIFATEKVGVMLAVAVKDEFQGKGIGRNLLKLRKDWFKENDAKYALTNSWNSKSQFSSPRLYAADGFELLSHFSNYIHPSKGPSGCPKCTGVCRCENFIFIKKL
jgi:GNAT superfamily N-acetyltransferase